MNNAFIWRCRAFACTFLQAKDQSDAKTGVRVIWVLPGPISLEIGARGLLMHDDIRPWAPQSVTDVIRDDTAQQRRALAYRWTIGPPASSGPRTY